MIGTVPLVTSNYDLFIRVKTLMSQDPMNCEIRALDVFEDTVEFLNLEMPDLVLIDFSSDRVNGFSLIEAIQSDPWLHHGGIIGLCHDYEESKQFEAIRNINTIAIIAHEDLERDLPRIMEIIYENQRILFQKEIGTDFIDHISASFKLCNDILDIRCYGNIVCNFLYNSRKIDLKGKYALNLALTEMLMNAIEHGNCGITYDEKSAFLDKGGYIEDLIMLKNKDASIASKRVLFDYSLDKNSARFLISDEGEGFDWRKYQNKIAPENMFELHGRGIMMSKNMVGALTYNEKGNSVTFEFPFTHDIEIATPGLFAHIEPREVSPGDIIFNEGETSDNLLYIVKGQFDVIVKDTIVSTLNPDDVLMGEMSFLLNNRRSAMIRARTPGKVIEITKKAFIEAIKRKPHYALFLSRLLAQRIQRLNSRSVETTLH